jgi:hypothetical protein
MYNIRHIVGLPNDLEIRLELKQTPQTLSKRWMIVRYHNCDEGNHCFGRAFSCLTSKRPEMCSSLRGLTPQHWSTLLWHFSGGLNSTLVGCPQEVQFAFMVVGFSGEFLRQPATFICRSVARPKWHAMAPPVQTLRRRVSGRPGPNIKQGAGIAQKSWTLFFV